MFMSLVYSFLRMSVWFGDQDSNDIVEYVEKSFICFLVQTVKDLHSRFFKHLREFTSEALGPGVFVIFVGRCPLPLLWCKCHSGWVGWADPTSVS